MRQGLGGEAQESWVTLFLPQFLSSHPVLISWLTSPLCLPHIRFAPHADALIMHGLEGGHLNTLGMELFLPFPSHPSISTGDGGGTRHCWTGGLALATDFLLAKRRLCRSKSKGCFFRAGSLQVFLLLMGLFGGGCGVLGGRVEHVRDLHRTRNKAII